MTAECGKIIIDKAKIRLFVAVAEIKALEDGQTTVIVNYM